ncbi:MAG: UDP-N-acetylglucosamine--N-acetylmuramyl-(pentapeptide) pyrophosphoryl-undecaprenol N-acetylglucosamine transferase [Candidatus Levybacteria bacterium]|nr:UDP-N-acetylglucosamine--N-acetylmuramyl-(pentapeptide) pyrophosphoryl-undecaprenol N-acetylglucosamine transferase [Candidatus Levybacteria bacterium]
MRIIIIGGHLSPALSVVEELKGKNEILFIGRKKTFEADPAESLEYKMMKELNIPFALLSTGRFQRKFTKHTIPSLFKLVPGFISAFMVLHKFKPDIILGFGGYLQIPIVFASSFLNIPVVIHEQTLEAGLANKICSFIAKKICISWEASRKFFPKEKTILTGNPVRKIFSNSPLVKNELPLVYITGGSSGSHFINTLIEDCISMLLKNFRIIHQAGDAKEFNDFERLSALKEKLDKNLQMNYEIKKFIADDHELIKIYQEAQIIVSRAGINTVTELIYLKKPAILIPIPFSQKDEQNKNALFLKKLGLGEVLNQEEASPRRLLHVLGEIKENINNYKIKDSEYKKVVKKNAASEIIKVLRDEKKKK